MEEKIILSTSTVLYSKKIKSKNVYLAKISDTMFIVVAFSDNNKIYSRSFVFNRRNKKIILKEARKIYRFILECFYTSELLEEI